MASKSEVDAYVKALWANQGPNSMFDNEDQLRAYVEAMLAAPKGPNYPYGEANQPEAGQQPSQINSPERQHEAPEVKPGPNFGAIFEEHNRRFHNALPTDPSPSMEGRENAIEGGQGRPNTPAPLHPSGTEIERGPAFNPNGHKSTELTPQQLQMLQQLFPEQSQQPEHRSPPTNQELRQYIEAASAGRSYTFSDGTTMQPPKNAAAFMRQVSEIAGSIEQPDMFTQRIIQQAEGVGMRNGLSLDKMYRPSEVYETAQEKVEKLAQAGRQADQAIESVTTPTHSSGEDHDRPSRPNGPSTGGPLFTGGVRC